MSSGKECIEILMQRGMSKYQISKRLGVSWNTIHRWVLGQAIPRAMSYHTMRQLVEETTLEETTP